MIQGLLQITTGPTWRYYNRELARVVETGGYWWPTVVLLEDGRSWAIRRKPDREHVARRRRLRQLAGSGYELVTEGDSPAVWSEQLGTRAMRQALTEHVGVGLGWVDRWRLANATSRAFALILDLVTAEQRFELRPRFEAVAYPVYPAPIRSERPSAEGGYADHVQATAMGRLLDKGAVVAEGGFEQFRVLRPMPLEVALLASYVIYEQRPRPS